MFCLRLFDTTAKYTAIRKALMSKTDSAYWVPFWLKNYDRKTEDKFTLHVASSAYLNRKTPCKWRAVFCCYLQNIYIVKEGKSRSSCAVYFLQLPLLSQKLSSWIANLIRKIYLFWLRAELRAILWSPFGLQKHITHSGKQRRKRRIIYCCIIVVSFAAFYQHRLSFTERSIWARNNVWRLKKV